MKKPLDYDRALLRMADWCAAAERCEADCRRKMAAGGLPPADADRVIEYLYDHRYLDTDRFARAFVADKARFNHWGALRIRRELALRRIPRASIDAAITSIPPEDYAGYAAQAAKAAIRTADPSTPDGRRRFVQRMASRGYEWSIISRILTELGADTDDDCYEEPDF